MGFPFQWGWGESICRRMTRYEAFIEKNWREHGLAHLLVVRKRGEGSADLGVFLVDTWCLGVKDAYGESDVPGALVDELVEERLPEETREGIHPACAKKLIEGAIAYAENLGFAPHRDYRKARRVLSGIEASLCPTDFTFGRDGRPCYLRGPDDSDERVDRVLARLDARCGPDGYDFVDPEEEAGDDAASLREELIDWLDGEPADVPRFYRFSGMVTALHLSPVPVSPTELLEVLWGPNGREWEDASELEHFTSLLMQYWNYVGDLIAASIAPDATLADQAVDVWSEDFEEDYVLPMMAGTIEWADGFMIATRLWREAWGDALARADLAEHWEILRWWAEFIDTGNKDLIADAAEAKPPRNIGLSVKALARALRSAPPG